MKNSKLHRAIKSIDGYLDSLSYNYIINERTDRLYEKLFHDIAGIILKLYKDLDVTANTELSIATDTTGNGIRTTITGYIKLSNICYLQIEKVYLPRGEENEEDN
jgi:hypothetical protein